MIEEDSPDEADDTPSRVSQDDKKLDASCDKDRKTVADERQISMNVAGQTDSIEMEAGMKNKKRVPTEGSDAEEDIDDTPGVPDEREAGDGQEEAAVDDDEDRRNPQYIPKRGVFYEHDDREEEEIANEESKEGETEIVPEKRPGKQKVWRSEQTEKWGHDKFLELEQEPKSKEELVASYGYDIRNEDNAPRARRRRRYGRGPNKYTRKWEDEDAYTPAMGAKTAERGRGGVRGGGVGRGNRAPRVNDKEEFPSLENRDNHKDIETQKEDVRKKGSSDRTDRNERTDTRNSNNSQKRGGGGTTSSSSSYNNNRNRQMETQDKLPSNRGGQNAGNKMSQRGGGRGNANNQNRNIRNSTAGDQTRGFGRGSSNQSDVRPPAPFPNTNAKKLVDQVVDTKLDMIDKNMSNLKIKIDNTDRSVSGRDSATTISPKNQSQRNREVTNTSSPKLAMSPNQANHRSTASTAHFNSKDDPGFDDPSESRPKRYSSLRQPRGNNRNNQNTANEGGDEYQQNVSYQHQDQYSQESRDRQQNFGSPVTVPTPMNAGGTTFSFPSNGNGPPPNAPFLPVAGAHNNSGVANSAVAAQLAAVAGTSTYIPPPPGMTGFAPGPHPPGVPGSAVQYGGVPVTVGSLTALMGAHSSADLAVLAAATNPHLHPHQTVSSAEQVMAIAAAGANAASGNQGYAEVRGGVTYFNPTAQPTVMSRPPVNKRPKAAIPIVDPSQNLLGNEKGIPGELSLSHQNSLDSSDQVLISGGASLSNSGSQDMKLQEDGNCETNNVNHNIDVSDIKSKPLAAV